MIKTYSLAELSNLSTNSNSEGVEEYFGGLKSHYMTEQVYLLGRFFRFRILNHTIFWMTIVLIFAYLGSLFGGTFSDNFINMLVLCPPQIFAAYLLVYYQIPRLLFRGKWILFISSFLIVAYFTSILSRVLVVYVVEPVLGREGIDESFWEIMSDPIYLVQVYTVVIYIPAIILFLIKMASEKFKQEKQVQALQAEKRNMELSFLKAQMNPHFLFNTLNNIYALAKEQADETPEMIMKLSELLDYTIYECQDSYVSIGKEWELIENFSDLQALRFSEPLAIRLDAQIEDDNVQIAPLILISLVENAFKYALQSPKPEVLIKLEANRSKVHILIRNSRSNGTIDPIDGSRKKIGVKNVTAQLDLQYKDKYEMVVNESTNEYEVDLMIEL